MAKMRQVKRKYFQPDHRLVAHTNVISVDLLATFPTKRTPIINVQFTPRNLCLVGGVYQAPENR
jgi:hypothetical protein